MQKSPDLKYLALLEKESKKLELSNSELDLLFSSTKDYTLQFISDIDKRKTYSNDYSSAAKIKEPISEKPGHLPHLIKKLQQYVDKPGINPASGGHLGYIPGGGLVPSAFADLMADITNRYAGLYFANPGAVHLENQLINWVANEFGYPETAAGNLASGGSIANLTAIVTAREKFDINSENIKNHVIYMTDHIHHSIDKAIRIAGLKECPIRVIEKDKYFRMNPKRLYKCIQDDLKLGLIPFLVIASAGTTDTGSIDPLEEIGLIANKQKCWYHIDGAYGGFFILTEEGRQKLKGFELSDSFVVDPHKGLFLPYGLGIVIVKNKQDLYHAHYYQAHYMQDAYMKDVPLSPADLSPELTKHFRGLRMWLPLHYYGLKTFRASLQEKLELSRYFYHKIDSYPEFEVGPYPDLSVTIFRLIRKNKDLNLLNKLFIKAIHEDGRVFISSTEINGDVWIRLAVLAFRTHKNTIDKSIEMLIDCSKKL